MRTYRVAAGDMDEVIRKIRAMAEGRTDRVEGILRRHGAIIEARAATITPVDKGFLRRANEHLVLRRNDDNLLVIQNRMVYAKYQHNYVHRHSQPAARDHFIQIPFEAEIPDLVADIIKNDMEALQ